MNKYMRLIELLDELGSSRKSFNKLDRLYDEHPDVPGQFQYKALSEVLDKVGRGPGGGHLAIMDPGKFQYLAAPMRLQNIGQLWEKRRYLRDIQEGRRKRRIPPGIRDSEGRPYGDSGRQQIDTNPGYDEMHQLGANPVDPVYPENTGYFDITGHNGRNRTLTLQEMGIPETAVHLLPDSRDRADDLNRALSGNESWDIRQQETSENMGPVHEILKILGIGGLSAIPVLDSME